jgi:predicted hydrolase (HD superfamily)
MVFDISQTGGRALNREEALELVHKHLKNKNLIKHSLAVEACMQAMAERTGGEKQ